MRTNALTKTALLMLLFGAGTAALAQTKYWVGGTGHWAEADHWSNVPNGAGGAGVPRVSEDVVIVPSGHSTITLPNTAWCNSLVIDATHGAVRVEGSQRQELNIAGGWDMRGEVDWAFNGTVRAIQRNGGVEVDTRGIDLACDLVFDGSGTWSLASDLRLSAGSITVKEGTLITNDNLLVARRLSFAERGEPRMIAGGGVVMLDEMPDRNALRSFLTPGNSTWVVDGGTVSIDRPAPDGPARDINVCGTGVGQTPFTVNAQLTSNYNGFGVRCRGNCNGTVTASVTGGVGPFTFQWLNFGPTTATWTTACGGIQIVIVTDVGQGISCPAQVNVTEPAPLGVIFFGQGTPPTCADVCNGTRTALAVGGVPPHTYNWNNGAGNSSTFGQLCAGTNTLQITDLNNCTFDTVFVFNIQPVIPNLTFTDINCFGECDGTAQVAPAGGTAPLSVLWSPQPPSGQGTNSVSGLCPGDWSVTITDANGCDSTRTFTIAQPPPILPDLSTEDATCSSSCDGAASVQPTGASGPFDYQWAPEPGAGQGTANATALCAGPYTVTITDQATGCDTTVAFVIDAPSAIDPQGLTTAVSCAGECDGTVVLSPVGGTPPYLFTWTPEPGSGQGTASVGGLCAGDWTVLVSDAAGCDTTVVFTITEPPPLDPVLTHTDVTCAGDCDGTATVVVNGGVEPYIFLWAPAPPTGQGTGSVSGLCAGDWSVLVEDANGCDTTIQFTVVEPPPLVAVPDRTDVTCGALCDGTASVVVSGGTPDLTYQWTPEPGAGQGTPQATGLCAGAYSVLITDANGCELVQDFVISDPVAITLSLQFTPASCPDLCDGTAGVIAGGGVAPYDYTWSPEPGAGQGTSDVTGLCPQAYLLTVTDAVGCDTTIAFTIDAPDAIIPNGTVTDATCAGTCDGTIDLAPTGGNGTFVYSWLPDPPIGQGTAMASGLCAGSWQVTIASGACDTTLTFVVNEPPPIDAGLVTTDPTCASACDGTATVTPAGGMPPYSFTWAPDPITGQGTNAVTGLCPGAYTVVLADAAGCDTTIAFEILQPVPITIDLLLTPADCGGACNGTAVATVSGGVGPYGYFWQPEPINGQGTDAVSDLCPGAYGLTITDAAGCDTTVQFIIDTPSGIDAVPAVTDASCGGTCDGAIDVVTAGGVPPYGYQWTPAPPIGQGTPNVSGLCAGVWTVTISDAASCDTTILITVIEPPAIVPNGSSTDETCNGPCDGTASVAPTGGQAPYGFVWTPQPPAGQGSASVSGLCPGDWSVTITDNAGCDSTVTFTILPSIPVDAGLVSTDGPCANECGGTAIVSPSGGVAPYTILWSPEPAIGQGTDSVSGLCAGAWQVTVTDAVGCDTTIAFNIDTPSAIVPALTTTPETCDGPCTGTATVAPTGGTGAIVILWTPEPGAGQGTPTATGLCAATAYTVTLTDDNGCDTTIAFTVDPFEAIVANISSTPASCAGVCDGTATAGPTGGVAPYQFAWSPEPGGGQGTPQATGLCPGIHELTITDAEGCAIVETVLILAPDPLESGSVVTDITCAGECDGSIVLSPSGGTGPYTFVWSPLPPNGQGSNGAFGLCPGDWTVTMIDANGCDSTLTFTLLEPPVLSITTQSTPSQCQLCIGTASVQITGGTPDHVILWTNAAGDPIGTDPDIMDLCAGLYRVTVTDANGCSAQLVVPIDDEDGEVLTTTDGNTSCPNSCDGTVEVAFVCSDPPCIIAWTDEMGNDLGQNGNVVSGLCAGDYFVEVTNASGCLSVDTATVVAPTAITLNISSTPASCSGVCDGTATLGVAGGIPPFTFLWNPAPAGGQGTPFATGLCAGVYTILVGDGGGCDTAVSVLILEPAPLLVTEDVVDISCAGQCDGTITLAVQGGTGPYTYSWSPAPPNGQGGSTVIGLCAGDWAVTVTDANGCSLNSTYTITEPTLLEASATSTVSTCPLCDGTATAVVLGGTAPFGYSWSLGGMEVSTDPVAIGLCGGLYTLLVTDANGCTAQAVVTVADGNGEELTTTDGQTTCANTCDGSVSVSFVCSAPDCSTIWTDANGAEIAQNTLSVSGLCAGIYTVQVTNGNGCVSFAEASVLPSTVIIPNLSSTPASCAGACDGVATVGPVGGVAPYTFLWDPEPALGQGTPQAEGLCAGVYEVSISDDSGCDTTVTVLILEPLPIILDAVVSDTPCEGSCEGSIVVTPQGGTAPYQYSWDPVPPNGQGGNSATGLCAGDVSLTVTDDNGCTSIRTWTIGEPAPIVLQPTSMPSECGLCNGSAEVEVSGGTAPYTYQWTLAGAIYGTGTAITDLCAGLYTVIVTDANGCQAALLVPISDSDGEVLTTTGSITSCPGVCDGQVSVDFTCSDPACMIAWFDAFGNDLGQNMNTLSDLCAGAYLVQVTNATGCVTIDTAFVSEPDPILPNLSTTPVSCFGQCDGIATVGPTGGVPPYEYLWVPDPPVGQGTPQAEGLCAGAYDVVITDDSGCSITVGVLVLEPAQLTADLAIQEPGCNGVCDGSIVVTPVGGVGPFSYNWTPEPPNGQGNNSATDLCAGTWAVLVTDVNGCDTTYTIDLAEPTAITADVTITDAACFGACTGALSATITGGVGPFTITWTNGAGMVIAQDTTAVDGLCAGEYTLSIVDANGCSATVNLTISQGDPIIAGLLTTNETCFGPCDGSAAVQPTGGVGPYLIDWQPEPPNGQGTAQVTGLCAGDYTVTITDDAGCDTTVTFTILPFQPILANATVTDVQCNAACNGSILLAASGGGGGYTYFWDPEPPNGQGTDQATGLCPGNISVTIADLTGCDSTFTWTITEPPALAVAVDQVTDASCATANDGAIDISVTGGTGPYTFSWTGPDGYTSGNEDIADLFPGAYTVTVTDDNGCIVTLVVPVNALSTVMADAGADLETCFGTTTILDGSASTGGTSYNWTDAQGDPVGTDPVVDIGVLAPGTYTYTLTVSDGPCSATDEVVITILALPIADAGPDRTIFLSGTVTLGGSPTGPTGSTYLWAPDSVLTDPTVAGPIAEPSITTWFTVTVTAPNGCVAVDSVLVTVIPEVVIPSGVTPNGDGWNDAWVIDHIDLFPECEVEIYNRWGDMLFRSVGYRTPWDGRYNGDFVPVGTYYYVVKLNDPRFPEAYTGPLTVIR